MSFPLDLDFYVAPVHGLSEAEYEWCYENNLASRGRIRDELIIARSGEVYNSIAVLAQVGGVSVGWALIFADVLHHGRAVGLFVPEQNRRLGIGTQIVNQCLDLCDSPPNFYPDNLERAKFFKNFDGRFSCPLLYQHELTVARAG